MQVENKIAFGDISDIMRGDKVVKSEGGTIHYTLNTCREFTPGRYIVHLVKENLIILAPESVDPIKIKDYLLKTDIGSNVREENYINRYDWMHYRNWECEIDEESPFINYIKKYNYRLLRHCFITTDPERLLTMGKDKISLIRETRLIYDIVEKKNGKIIGFICDITRHGDWNYGSVLKDKKTNKCFAFIYEDLFTLNQKACEKSDELLKFDGNVDIQEFYYNPPPSRTVKKITNNE